MSTDSLEESIFDAARQLADPVARTKYLNRACQGNDPLLARIERLLSAHSEGAFLEVPAGNLAATTELPVICEQAGTMVGPYKLLEQIGEGGMGLVFMAEQSQPLRRRVALKIIKPGLDTKAVIARFEAERQALALMEHPNIARVFDAGTTDGGRPYFVMEMVRGVPITDYCARHEFDLRGRLELFIQVCQAVQHAHQKGIIHRDLKPTNILVAHDDTTPVPKVIDFGVAKATSQQLTDRTLFTHFAQIIGTPLYMSPEQAELNYHDVDTRSDVYSLGVVLYELLTGTTPFDAERLRSVGPDEMRRIIREEDPPKPSTQATTRGAVTTAVAPNKSDRRFVPALALKGDLDWIVMKCLDKDRNRRYASASELADDVARYLSDEPVKACPPSAIYRFRKFARRHRAGLGVAGAAVLFLLVGLAGLLVSSARIRTEQAATAQALQESTSARTEANEALTLARSRLQVARQAVDEMYTDVAQKWLARDGQLTPLQRTFLEKALALYEQFADEPDQDPGSQLEAARARLRIGVIKEALGQLEAAVQSYEGALAKLEALYKEQADLAAQDLALALTNLGKLHMHFGRDDEAEKHLKRAIVLQQRLVAEEPHNAQRKQFLADMLHALAYSYVPAQRFAEAEPLFDRSLNLLAELHAAAPDDIEITQAMINAAEHCSDMYIYMQRFADAARVTREALKIMERLLAGDPKNPEFRFSVASLSSGLANVTNGAEKQRYSERAYTLLSALVEEFPARSDYRSELVASSISYSYCLDARGEHDLSETVLRAGVAAAERLVADEPGVDDHQSTLAVELMSLSKQLAKNGKAEEAKDVHRRTTKLIKELIAADSTIVGYRRLLFLHALGTGEEPEDAHEHEKFFDSFHEGLGRYVRAEGASNQTDIAITGADDATLDGDAYHGLDSEVLTVVNTDNDAEGFLYWADSVTDSLMRSRLDGSETEALAVFDDLSGGRIGVDPVGGKIYWVTQSKKNLRRASLDGTNVETILTLEAGGLRGVELDLPNGKIYWGDFWTHTVHRANLDVTNIETIFSAGGGINNLSFALDVPGGKIYWTQGHSVLRSNLDGTNPEILWTDTDPVLTTPGASGKLFGIALDLTAGKAYWSDSARNVIYRSHLDGSSAEILLDLSLVSPNSELPGVLPTVSNVVAITVDAAAGKFYWTDNRTQMIYRANLDGTSIAKIAESSRLEGVTIARLSHAVSVTHRTGLITTEAGGSD